LKKHGYHRLQKWAAIALARYPGPCQSPLSLALAKRIAALGTRMMQFHIGVILVMLRDLSAVIDKVIFWQSDRLLHPAKNTDILGSLTLATLHTDTHEI